VDRSPFADHFDQFGKCPRVLVNDFDCDPDRLRALPDCVNNGVFRPAEEYAPQELAALRAELGVPAGHKLLVYLGLLAEYQGTTHLLQAMQRLLARRQDVTLLLMGFPGEDIYRQKARDLGIAEHVIFTGRVPYGDAPRYLALGDAAVSPKLSVTEGAGKLLNYMAVALPTVAFDTPVAREYLGGYGLLAVRADVESLTAQLETAIFDEAVAHSLGRQLRQRAVEHYDWSAAGEQIVQVYAELLGDVAPIPAPARLGNVRVYDQSEHTGICSNTNCQESICPIITCQVVEGRIHSVCKVQKLWRNL
jgi:glycosyltransferase involved in cell wall biosynthesis